MLRFTQRQIPWGLLCLSVTSLTLLLYVFADSSFTDLQVFESGADLVSGALHKSLLVEEGISPTVIQDIPHDEYLAVCLYVRNQAQDLPEWFQHHYYHMNIRRFYVMDDGSDPPISHYKHTFGIPEEVVDFVYRPLDATLGSGQKTQHATYDICAFEMGVNNTWIAFIDADEFLDTPGGDTIETILRDLETGRSDVGALGVNWAMHTSSNQILHTEPARKMYLECVTDDPEHNGASSGNRHVKSIVRSDAYISPANPHKFNLRPGLKTVGEHGDDITVHGGSDAFRLPITRDRISLHHYQFKSFEDYADKMTRTSYADWTHWNLVNYQEPHVACADMLKYFPATVNKAGLFKKRYWLF